MSAILPDLFSRLKNQVQEYVTYAEVDDLEFTHLLPNFNQLPKLKFRDDGSFAAILARRSSPLPLTYERQDPSPLDIRLLKALADDPRATIVSLAAKLDCSRQTVSRRMQHLIERKVIISFGVGVDYQRLGFTGYHLLFRLRPGLTLQALQAAFRGVPEVYYAGTAHGAYDLSVNLHCRTPQELGQIVQHIRKAFGTHVVHCDMLVYDRIHHWKQFSPAVAEALNKV
jgi:DNA-binding Lrp family transcriptional regulator